MSNQPVKLTAGESRQKGLEPFFTGCKAVIVLVKSDETEEQAWQNHLKKHPEDIHADVRIFHLG